MTKFHLRKLITGGLFVWVSALSIFAQSSEQTRAEARGAADSMEAQLVNENNDRQRYILLRYLPSAAFVAGDFERAETKARDLLRIGEEIDRTSRFKGSTLSDTTHVGNTILGLIEMNRNNVPAAKEHLLASARFTRTAHPVHTSFGPSMALAKSLLERGERQAVIEYLDLCTTFWKNSNGKLDEWKRVLEVGQTPDFGANAQIALEEWRYRR